MSQGEPKAKKNFGIIFVPLVLVIGATIGILVYLVEVADSEYLMQFPFEPAGFRTFQEMHIILSTIGIALLIALIVVYARTYIATKANFILGLLVVLFALLLQSILTFQPLMDYEAPGLNHPVLSSPIADVFMIVAYAVFLYLSLE
ncbi:MAG: hypothetical protein ACYC7D_07265 [Nitrososphaerales archaeon]